MEDYASQNFVNLQNFRRDKDLGRSGEKARHKSSKLFTREIRIAITTIGRNARKSGTVV
jgi:hypothetical protein